MKAAIAATMALPVCLAPIASGAAPGYCGPAYETSLDQLAQRDGYRWRVLPVVLRDGRHLRRGRNGDEWSRCECATEDCTCCDYDLARLCEWSLYLNATTNDHLHVDGCKEGVLQ